MARRLPPLNPLKAFEAAARHAHVGRAATELNVTHSAVSHQIRTLEDTLGVKLFERQGRRVKLTQAGQLFLPSIREAFDLIAEASSRVFLPKLEGRLTIHAPPGFTAKWLVRRVGSFFEAYPKIELTITPNRLDSKEFVDDADVYIEYGDGHWDGKWVRLLCGFEVFPVCSPRLLNARVPLRAPEDLRHHTLLHDDDGRIWARWLSAAGVDGIEVGKGMRFSNAHLSIDAAVFGHGVALGDRVLGAEDLSYGTLVKPFDLSVPGNGHYYVVCEYDRLKLPMVQVFVEWLFGEIGLIGGPAA